MLKFLVGKVEFCKNELQKVQYKDYYTETLFISMERIYQPQ